MFVLSISSDWRATFAPTDPIQGNGGGRERRQAGRQAGTDVEKEGEREGGCKKGRVGGGKKKTNHFAHEERRRARDFGEQDAEDVAA